MGQIMRERSAAGVDLFDHGWSQMGFDGNVRWRADNLFPGFVEHDPSRLRIEPKIKFVARIAGELRVVGARI